MNRKLIFKIREPYWGAWKRYGWDRGVWGVGLNLKRLKSGKERGVKEVLIKTRGETYQISMLSLTRLFRKERPVERKKGIQLLVVPNKILK